MDLTKDDFDAHFADMEKAIAECDFMALDFEMSGISVSDKKNQPNYMDSPQERYAKMRRVTNQFSIIQLGLATFTKEDGEAGRKIYARPYNMYAFPASGSEVVLSVDAINFLKGQNMDFQRWIYEGVSFVDGVREAQLLEQLERDREWDRKDSAGESRHDDGNRITLTKSADKKWIETEMKRIDKWLAKLAKKEEGEAAAAAEEGGGQDDGEKAEEQEEAGQEAPVANVLLAARANAFMRRALREAIQDKYPGMVVMESRGPQLALLKLTEEEKAERLKKRDDERVAKTNAIVGLRRVFKAMAAANRPLVVHNGMYDLMFLFKSLVGPLPELLKDFKTQLKEAYPGVIYDTKYVATREDLHKVSLADTTVEALYETLVKGDKWDRVALKDGFKKYDTSNEDHSKYAHEAGYDAYLTGANFARFRYDLLETFHSKQLQNRIYNYRSLFNTVLEGEDQLQQKGHVFHVAISPAGRSLKTDDLMKLFGENSVRVYVLWGDEANAFAVVDKSVEYDAVVSKLQPRGEVKLTPYDDWWAIKKAKEDEYERSLLAPAEAVAGGSGGLLNALLDAIKRPWSMFKASNGPINGGAAANGNREGGRDVSPGTERGMKKPRMT